MLDKVSYLKTNRRVVYPPAWLAITVCHNSRRRHQRWLVRHWFSALLLEEQMLLYFHNCTQPDSYIEDGALLRTMGCFCSPHWHWKCNYSDSSSVIRIIFVVIVSLCLAIPFHRLIKKLVYLTCLSIFHRPRRAFFSRSLVRTRWT